MAQYPQKNSGPGSALDRAAARSEARWDRVNSRSEKNWSDAYRSRSEPARGTAAAKEAAARGTRDRNWDDGVDRVRVSPMGGGRGAALPLTAYRSGIGQSTVKVRVRPGTVCGIMPTIAGYPLSAAAAELTISASGSFYLYLFLEFDDEYDEEPSAVSVISSAAAMQNASDEAYILLGLVSGGKVANYLSGSLGAAFCSPRLLYWQV